MTDADYNAIFTDDDWRAVLTTEGGVGLFRLTAEDPDAAAGEEGEVEVLLQPRTANGLPQGPVQRLFSTRIRLRLTPDRKTRCGRCWLPAHLKPKLLRVCYFRVHAGTMGGERTG